jgi:hypothetical protein
MAPGFDPARAIGSPLRNRKTTSSARCVTAR